MTRAYTVGGFVALFLISSLWADELTCRYVAPDPGSSRVVTQSSQLSMDTKVQRAGADVQEIRQEHTTTKMKEEKLLEFEKDGFPSKLEVTYHEATQTRENSMTAEPTVKDTPVHGKAYRVVRNAEDKVSVTTAVGKPVDSVEEREYVEREYGALGTDGISGFLHERTFKKDEAVEVPKELAETLFKSGTGLTVDKFVLTYKETRVVDGASRAAFDTEVVMTTPADADLTMKMDINGETLVSMSCRPVRMDLKGRLSISGTQTQPVREDRPAQQLDITGTGEVELLMRTEYTK